MTGDLQWWISVIGVPVSVGLFWLIMSVRKDGERAIDDFRDASAKESISLREDLYNFKLRTSEMYVTNFYMKDVEMRIMSRLDKIDLKVDQLIGLPLPRGRK